MKLSINQQIEKELYRRQKNYPRQQRAYLLKIKQINYLAMKNRQPSTQRAAWNQKSLKPL
jgi:hypothetical protein